MFDDSYFKRRSELLKDIKRMTKKDESNHFPLLQTADITDSNYIDRCELQLEQLEKAASIIASKMMH